MPSASSCTDAPFPAECATVSRAVAPLIASFEQYSILTAPEQAALFSWQAFESAEYKYNSNKYPAPGRPGQGTRNTMMPNYVAEYAASIPALSSAVAAASDPAAILELVQPDEYYSGGAAWFYANISGAQIKAGVQSGGRKGWEAFVTGCVGTSVDRGNGEQTRVAYWEWACEVLGVPAT